MENDLAISLGNAARQARKARGLTQARMAEQLDVSVEFYGRIERGVAWPSIGTFQRMVEVLGVSADSLLDRELLGAVMDEVATPAAADPPELCQLIAMLRQARPATLRLVSLYLNEVERAEARRARRE